ncbi:creatininase [Lampropedia cohaerens]|uniref:Creatininase n=1 Tax=Lampropedia cohaerens TaxID=1610491 RepID=A0A0U1Q2S9_9BURK|nr:creatininase family protein [Lampropedia cohaerens]KKW69046.1 creatininase [Lampropedia cohaerens]
MSHFEPASPPLPPSQDAEPAFWPHHRWADLGTRDFQLRQGTQLLRRTVAVLPLGATEQHGPHLPLMVDSAITDGIVACALQRLQAMPQAERPPALFLPLQPVGYSPEHASFPGTLTLSANTVLALWRDIGASVAAAGVRRLLLFNSHGGHVAPMDMVARELRRAHGLLVYSCHWFNLPRGDAPALQTSAWEQRFGVHAGEEETAILLHLHPELVDMQQAAHFRSNSETRARAYPVAGNGRSAKLGWMMEDYNACGAAGNAAAATPEKGQALVDNAARQLLALLQEISTLPLPGQPE